MKPFLSLCGYARSVSSRTLSAFVLVGALSLTGCAGVANIPDTIITNPSGTPNPIQGSVFGGHAPIVGAHVYILQAGGGGYAAAATNLMTSGSAGSDAHGNYALTDSNGTFNVTGDYTCTTGLPVYLAATGGQTSTNIGGSNYSTSPLTITSASALSLGSNTWLLTFNANNLLYPGQFVVFSGLSGTGWAALNGGVRQVTGAVNNSFTLLVSSSATFAGTTTGTAQPQSAINPAIANLAVLGNCPSTGNFSTSGAGSDVISYVYINEVSTAAAAYAFSGFGSGPFQIGYPSGDTLAKTGIQNASNNAAALYNIQGAYLSSTFAGEGHIANPTTPAHNGVAPQATMDTLGNILASCVDSNNLTNSATNPNVSGASDSCSTLFTYATSNGVPYGATGVGTIPTDTATAAFNIAHNPAGKAGYSSQFMTSVYSLQGSQVTPFAPNLSSQPNDFTVGIQYTAALNPGPSGDPSLIEGPEAVSVDASGNFWFTTQPTSAFTSGYIVEDSPLGVKLYSNYNSSWTYGDVTIDSIGNAWTGNQKNYVLATEIVPPSGGTTTYTLKLQGSSYTYAQGVAADGSGNVYVPHGPTLPPPASTDNDQTLTILDTAGVVSVGATGNMAGSFGPGAYMTHAAFDSSRDLWFTSNNGNVIARVNSSTAAAVSGFPINSSTATAGCPSSVASTIINPQQPALDASGNAWIPLYDGGSGSTVVEVTPAGACSTYTVGTGPYGATVDGANNLWVSNNAGNSISELSTQTGTAISPSTNYTVGGLLSGPLGLSVDLSGDLIITNFTGNSVVEVIGAATPTYLPLGVAAANNKLGAKP